MATVCPMSTPTSIRLPDDLQGRLDAYLAQHPGTRGEVIAQALDAWLDRRGGGPGRTGWDLLDLFRYVPLRDPAGRTAIVPVDGERIIVEHDCVQAPSFYLVGLYVRPRTAGVRLHSIQPTGEMELLPGDGEALETEGLSALHFGWPVGGPSRITLRHMPFVRMPQPVRVVLSATKEAAGAPIELFLVTLPPDVPSWAFEELDRPPVSTLRRYVR